MCPILVVVGHKCSKCLTGLVSCSILETNAPLKSHQGRLQPQCSRRCQRHRVLGRAGAASHRLLRAEPGLPSLHSHLDQIGATAKQQSNSCDLTNPVPVPSTKSHHPNTTAQTLHGRASRSDRAINQDHTKGCQHWATQSISAGNMDGRFTISQ